MSRPQQLLTPGPTAVPPEVLSALARPVLHHRSPDFAEVFALAQERLRAVYRTESEVLVFTASGTGAFESAIVNLLSPGERVLAVSQGEFGERWQAMARAFGCEVVPLAYAWGESPQAGRSPRGARRERRAHRVPRPLGDVDRSGLRPRAAPRRLRGGGRGVGRGRGLEPRRRAAGDRRVGRRRRRDRLAEGADDTARARVRRGLRTRVGANALGDVAALLLGLAAAAEGPGEALDPVHAGDVDRRRAHGGARARARRRARGGVRPPPSARAGLPRRDQGDGPRAVLARRRQLPRC